MGILNKILFWRHDDELDFDALAESQLKTGIKDDPLGYGEHMPDFEEKPLFPTQESPRPMPKGSPYKQTTFQQPQAPAAFSQQTDVNRDLELISSKLDTIKAMLSSLDQRTANLERAA